MNYSPHLNGLREMIRDGLMHIKERVNISERYTKNLSRYQTCADLPNGEYFAAIDNRQTEHE